jgi:hypothetical protein
MKRFISQLLILIAGWFIVHTTVVVYIGQSGNDFLINDAGSTKERFDDFERWIQSNTERPRALIVGSSTAYRNIDPAILDSLTNYFWYNLASSSQTIDVSAALAKIAMNRLPTIEILLIDVYPEIDSIENYEAAYDWVNNSGLSMIEKWQLIQTTDIDLRLLNAGYYRWIQHQLGWKEKLQPTTNKGKYLAKGYAYSLKKPNASWKIHSRIKHYQLDNNICKLIDWAKKNHLDVIVNVAPDLSFRYNIINQKGLTLLHHNDFVDQRNAHTLFYDSHHMTRKGGILYSTVIGKKLGKY